MFKMMVADVDSPSYIVATAAVKLGFFAAEGVEVEFIPVYGAKDGIEQLKAGKIHFFGGPAFAATRAFPQWRGAKLLCALAQNSYWFMGIRKDIPIARGDVLALKGVRIACSFAFPKTALQHMLSEAGLALGDVEIVESLKNGSEWHSLDGIRAIEENYADAFWGNGMRLALAEKAGLARMHIDTRRGDGPSGTKHYNFAALTVSDRLIERSPEVAAAAVRAIKATQKALQRDPSLVRHFADEMFPKAQAELMPELIDRDKSFYQAEIGVEALSGLNRFALANGLLDRALEPEEVIATQFMDTWL
ncbi:ABC transporter substrate-binding protein [Devosia sp. WQ 349]|uniref:ABC transporter substrate-binding protein n=1 Tax=Devosia sp. WQ 349K1 TaxID=2800329 RepID=UPI0019079967|nr:ABC transporter substrate-binding protein [Devosia sp. WQ 349K1]MBK1795500.1 ABC transporter substrate-binding protein [Devosia sp. WQ 349K1]